MATISEESNQLENLLLSSNLTYKQGQEIWKEWEESGFNVARGKLIWASRVQKQAATNLIGAEEFLTEEKLKALADMLGLTVKEAQAMVEKQLTIEKAAADRQGIVAKQKHSPGVTALDEAVDELAGANSVVKAAETLVTQEKRRKKLQAGDVIDQALADLGTRKGT